MSFNVASRTVLVSNSLLVCALLLVSCGDSDHATQAPPYGQAGARPSGQGGTSGEAGSLGVSAGEGGSAETRPGEAGSAGEGATVAGDAGTNQRARCYSNSDCDDGLFCNGIERCLPAFEGTDAKVCMGREFGPCGAGACDETKNSCNCDEEHSDEDHDGYLVPGCTKPGQQPDCDDTDATRNPGQPEVCDGLLGHNDHDEDCDETTIGSETDRDKDSDRAYDAACSNRSVYQPLFSTSATPLTVRGTDCDDRDASVYPGAPEYCDDKDNNCNGEKDEVSGGLGDPHTYYRDKDGDFWGSDTDLKQSICNSPPPGYSTRNGDCDDNDSWVNPGREEICNGIDDDCDPQHKVDQPDKPGDLMFLQPYDGVTDFKCLGKEGWKVQTCPVGRLDCDNDYKDACETIATTLCNCHACGKTCAFSCGETDCEEIAALSTGDLHTCAIVQPVGSISGGSVACWGQNASGQLGLGSTKDALRPTPVPDLLGVTAIASGNLHTCAIAVDGLLVCWGNNESGQLGSQGDDRPVTYPTEVYQPPPTLKAKALGSGSFHTCAIFEDGRLECWGQGEQGQLGNRGNTTSHFPVRVKRLINGAAQFVNDATQVVAGYAHTCSLSAGKVECWGDNSAQQLGIDPASLDSSNVARPVDGLAGIQVDEISASSLHTCARAGGDVYCWGDNQNREIALSGDVRTAPPTKIPLSIRAAKITTGVSFGCAVSAFGEVYCWGSNDFGERGVLDNPPNILPTAVPITNAVSIFGGVGGDVCSSKKDSTTWCWGKNDAGQLGGGEVSLLPHPIATLLLNLSGSQTCL